MRRLRYTLTAREVKRDGSSIDIATITGLNLSRVAGALVSQLYASPPDAESTAVDMRLTWAASDQ